ncbi:MAG: flagellar hook-associated protein FlgK [Desulfobacterales bacterium]|nr:flagellar hook-associated protein FlgK [Desulfobacterales bacterium]
MPNISNLLNIASTALTTQQRAIDITGNNIANVNTEGYSRLRVNMVQSTPVRDHLGSMSTGVHAEQKIERFYDRFITMQLNNENENLGRWDAQKTALEKVEVLFDEVSGFGLGTAMADYWNSWQDVINNPSGHVERTSLLSAAQYMANTFNQLSENITKVQEDIGTNVTNIVGDINQIADQIAELNRKVTQVEVNGHNANDYRDQRDLLVLNLSKLIDIDSFEDGDGNITIMVGGGKPLVERTATWDLSTVNVGGVVQVYWNDSSGGSEDITTRIASGELKGWIEARDVVINDYQTRLDDLAATMIAEVNTLHSAGYGLDGVDGRDFFIGTGAADMAVNPVIEADVELIAAASDPLALPGDNDTAMAIFDLQNTLTMAGGGSTFDDFYISLVGDVGSDVRQADLNFDHQTTMMSHLSNYREEVSGVSLDEEMVNLVKFQHAYTAAAKLITTTDEMMDTIIGMKR